MDLANCAEDVLQAVINRCDREDLFLLRLVSRRFRTAVNRRIRRISPGPQWLPKLAAECPNVEVLELFQVPSAHERSLVLHQLPRLHELLDFSWADEIAPLPGVTRLRLHDDEAEVLDGLATTFPALQMLQLASWDLTGADLPGIVGLAGTLTALDLGPTLTVSMEVLIGLLALNTGRLEELRIWECEVEDDRSEDEQASDNTDRSHEFYRQLAAFTSLRTLQLDYIVGLAAEGVEQLATLTHLTSLRLGGLCLSCEQLAPLTRLTSLAELSIYYALRALSESWPPRLSRDGDPPGGSTLRVLARFPRLVRLDIDNCRGPALAEEFAALTALTQLQAETAVLGLPGAMRSLTWLRELDLKWAIRSEAELRHLSGLISLTRLSLGGAWEEGDKSEVPLGDGLRWLAGMTALQDLDIRSSGSSCGGFSLLAGALAHLTRLPGLRRLSLPELGAPEELWLLEGLQLQQLHLPRFACYKLPPGLELAVQRHDRESRQDW